VNAASFALAIAAAAAPPAVLWWGSHKRHPWLALAAAVALCWLGPLVVQAAVDDALAAARGGWFGGSPHDWQALDQPARKALIDGIRTRLSHGKLVAQMPAIAQGLAAAAIGLQGVAWAYRGWQARRQPSLD